MSASAAGTVVVDSIGTRCPQPVIDLARAARGGDPGRLLELLSTDPASRHDVPAWCRMRGHTLVSIESGPGPRLSIVVRLGPAQAQDPTQGATTE